MIAPVPTPPSAIDLAEQERQREMARQMISDLAQAVMVFASFVWSLRILAGRQR